MGERTKAVLDQLFENAMKVKYGEVSVTLKIHDGRVAAVTHTTTESTRDRNIETQEM
jgi:hypothetical protein